MSDEVNSYLAGQLQQVLGEQVSALAEMKAAAKEFAAADSAYRGAKARAYLKHAVKGEGGKTPTVDNIKALVDVDCEAERDRQRIADANYKTATEYVRSLRTSVSAIQTLINHEKAQMELV
jgi:hypothetical protein